ncbi:branched-chain amino acid ABC transporter permease [Roseateles sp.]|uniref:branched-chain amino acid ABC transporter permease n=1 Tax=Roseateles sp. TaxID=1971397 RepID=UPI003BA99C73
MKLDPRPLALLATIMLLALPLTGSPSTWLNLTLAGIAMGLIIFVIASGLTLVFGLMDVLNFGHGVFIALGAFMATTVLAALAPWVAAPDVAANLAALAAACLAGMAIAAAVGVVFERVLVRPVYGQHLKQILITMGGMIIGEELIKASWGAQLIPLPMPETLRGIFLWDAFGADVAVEKFRMLSMVIGIAVLVTLLLVLNRTKLGLLIRAGVQDREMVEALGYRIRRLFVGVFVAGAALAGLGGVLWGLVQQGVTAQIGSHVNLLLFIVIIIGGLGSTVGCLVGALLVGLVANYAGFLAPKAALFSNIGLMVAVLLWRPQGLYPVGAK